ncbi:Thioesterase superfamily [Caminicella sporogenes DSM 14501]|uniref:Thioesterase superfamily n=1 Tax=Caminicella sporogenes DSM 14501 TaxID=1121266 RepID=A0A1M6QRX1_9FIRM|nr:thioesterase family protein [Caminicella sporogenes]RKD20933.1 thioesterase [Caminicella sporogenes]SHK23011.1 Thioesterase superfamily [Caminicella sporogenes DSM 14501]
MEFNLKLGMSAEVEKIVTENDTASAFGSGKVLVFATPMMIGIMENAALKAVDPHLPEEHATVGIHLDVKHMAATPVGMKVKAKAELIEINGKKLKFKVEAFDEKEKIGEGYHTRYIINIPKFLENTKQK